MFIFVHTAAPLQMTWQIMTTDKQQLWWRRDNNGAITNSKQQSTNAQHAQQWTRDNGRMRWRTTADEVEDDGSWRDAVDGWRGRSYNGPDDNDKNQQSISVRWQRRITTTAGKRRGVVVELEEWLFGGWQRLKRRGRQSVVEGQQWRWRQQQQKLQSTNEQWQRRRTTTAGERRGAVVEAEEQLFYGSGGETAPWRIERR